MFGVHDRVVLYSLIPRQNSPRLFSFVITGKLGLAEEEGFWNWAREGNVYYG